DLVVALDGHLGTIVESAVGSRRLEVQLQAQGGHSWGDYPTASAVHAMGDAIHALNGMNVPAEPRSSYNVGQVWGGTSINAIAQGAGFNLDLRSLDAAVLAELEREARERISRSARRHRVTAEIRTVGDRPTAKVANGLLVEAAAGVLESLGLPVRRAASSTDANASMAAGLPSIAFGVYLGGDAHRLSEWLDPASLVSGYEAFRGLMAELSCLGVSAASAARAS
ncbi:MAG TPA: peptidase dimerization domain-containing protein, partial [Trueperaceae bacterium]